jgi:hypothetical protein
MDQRELHKFLAEKLPQREISWRLNIPRSTLQRMIKGMDAEAPAQALASASGNGLPVVGTGKLTPAEEDALRADFWELIEWWRAQITAGLREFTEGNRAPDILCRETIYPADSSRGGGGEYYGGRQSGV